MKAVNQSLNYGSNAMIVPFISLIQKICSKLTEIYILVLWWFALVHVVYNIYSHRKNNWLPIITVQDWQP